MKTWLGIVFGIVGGFLGAGILYLIATQPKGEGITLLPPPTPAPIVVHVTGAVVHPGLYTLKGEPRVDDALAAAGGLLSGANSTLLNLAAYVQDGEQIWVPWKSEAGLPTENPSNGNRSPSPIASPSVSQLMGLININIATQVELETLPGIGPVLAQRIITYREENGPFRLIDDLQQVNGIGPTIFEKLKTYITIGPVP